ncbi:putative coiled-coil protein SlyX [Streptomyces sp. MJP52]|nr:putative coiled-coil protein SlyX [Streptomyces sp. MJP52]
MADMRGRIADRLAGAPTTEEDPLAGMTAQDIYDAVWRTDRFPAPATSSTRTTNPTWRPESVMEDVANRVRALDARTAAQDATITELSKAVAQLAADRDQELDADALVARIQTAIESITVRLDTTPEN